MAALGVLGPPLPSVTREASGTAVPSAFGSRPTLGRALGAGQSWGPRWGRTARLAGRGIGGQRSGDREGGGRAWRRCGGYSPRAPPWAAAERGPAGLMGSSAGGEQPGGGSLSPGILSSSGFSLLRNRARGPWGLIGPGPRRHAGAPPADPAERVRWVPGPPHLQPALRCPGGARGVAGSVSGIQAQREAQS